MTIDQRSIDAIKASLVDGITEALTTSLVSGIEQAFSGIESALAGTQASLAGRFDQMTEAQRAQQVSIDPQAIGQLQDAVVRAVASIQMPYMPVSERTESKPSRYRVNNVVTDRSGNILSADINPLEN